VIRRDQVVRLLKREGILNCAQTIGKGHGFLRRRMGSPDSVEDVFQTVFERLCKVRRADLVRKPAEYLFSVAINVMREWRLRDERDAQHIAFDTPALEEVGQHVDRAIADDSEALNLHRQLETALASLPEIQRRVLLALKRDGMTYGEASRALGISAAMVEKHFIEAKSHMLRRAWDR